MPVNVSSAVQDCVHCPKNQAHSHKRASPRKVFTGFEMQGSMAIRYARATTKKPTRLLMHHRDFVPAHETGIGGAIAAHFLRDVTQAVLEHWVCKYGPARNLPSENGKQFTSNLFQEVAYICKLLEITNKITFTYLHQNSRQVKQYIQTLTSMFCCYVNDHHLV